MARIPQGELDRLKREVDLAELVRSGLSVPGFRNLESCDSFREEKG